MSDYYSHEHIALPLFSNSQSRLLQQKPPSQRHSTTSKAAADSLDVETINDMQRRVLEFVISRGEYGSTDEECQHALEMNPSTQRPRRVELARAGLIVEAGKRMTVSRRFATVWIVAQRASARD